MKVKIVWSDEAKLSLKQIYQYIKNRESITVAKKIRDKIVTEVKDLVNYPEKYANEAFALADDRNVRSRVIWSYKIIY